MWSVLVLVLTSHAEAGKKMRRQFAGCVVCLLLFSVASAGPTGEGRMHRSVLVSYYTVNLMMDVNKIVSLAPILHASPLQKIRPISGAFKLVGGVS